MYVHVYVIIFILCDAFTTPHKLTSSALRVRATSGPCLGGCRRALQVVAEALAVIPSPHLAPSGEKADPSAALRRTIILHQS